MGQTESISADQAAALAEEQELKKKKRAEVIAEIIKTEETYVNCLKTVITVFMHPLLFEPAPNNQNNSPRGSGVVPRSPTTRKSGQVLKRPHITEEEVKTIFSIIEELYKIHVPFLEELVHEANPETGKECIGHVFLNNCDLFKMYTAYVNNYNKALETLDRCQQRKTFRLFMNEIFQQNQSLNLMGLATYLITPIQRIPRYVLLLNELKVKTLPTHEDYDYVCKAFEKVSAMADYIDRENKFAEMYQHILQIQNSIVDKVSLLSGKRELITTGQFSHIKEDPVQPQKKTLVPLEFFLFSDILLLTCARSKDAEDESFLKRYSKHLFGEEESTQKRQVEHYCYLPNVDIRDVADSKDEICVIELVMGERTYKIQLNSQEEKDKCIINFYAVRAKAHRIPFHDILEKKEESSPKSDNEGAPELTRFSSFLSLLSPREERNKAMDLEKGKEKQQQKEAEASMPPPPSPRGRALSEPPQPPPHMVEQAQQSPQQKSPLQRRPSQSRLQQEKKEMNGGLASAKDSPRQDKKPAAVTTATTPATNNNHNGNNNNKRSSSSGNNKKATEPLKERPASLPVVGPTTTTTTTTTTPTTTASPSSGGAEKEGGAPASATTGGGEKRRVGSEHDPLLPGSSSSAGGIDGGVNPDMPCCTLF